MLINKPWGYELIIETNDKYTVKLLSMKSENSCSLQYHENKHETFYLLEGQMLFEVGNSVDSLVINELNPGDYYIIKPGIIHRMIAKTDIKYLECSTSELDDVVRIKDLYGRI
jgi:mannose-6-phosphate isomerase-like protein (cupin superfamily)